MLTFYLPGNDQEGIRDVLADLDGGAGLPWQEPGAGLGCPDDPLDDVMDCLKSLDDGFLDEFGMGSPPPPRPVADVDGEVKDAPPVLDVASAPAGVPEEDFDVDMFFADGAPDDFGGVLGGGASSDNNTSWALPAAGGLAGPCDVAAPGFATLFPARGALDVVPLDSAPPLPAHDALNGVAAPGRAPMFPAPDASYGAALYFAAPLPAWPVLNGVVAPDSAPLLPAHDALACAVVPDTEPLLPAHDTVLPARPPTTSISSSGCVSSMTFETESAPPVSLSPLPATWGVVPRRKRQRPVTRRNLQWLPKFQLGVAKPPAAAAAAAPIKPGGSTKKPTAARRRNRDRQRQCSHCSSTETPQWRAGPRGPGTLCNACGIRFKQNKGVLFEEYRPCTSPSFEDGMHSNRQRKVDKIRERKEELLRLMMAQTVAAPPVVGGGEFIDVCT